VDGDFPWILVGAFLLWVFNLLGGKKRTRPERPQHPQQPRSSPPVRVPGRTGGQSDPTQREGSHLEELLRALEQRLDPTVAPAPRQRQTGPQRTRPPLGRPASRSLPAAEELEERESLETDPVVESLEEDVRRPERTSRDWLRQAEERDRARNAEVEARDQVSHKSRHGEFDRQIRAAQTAATVNPAARRLTTAQIRQAFIWGEILGRPKSER
jgi:hypothetical protein